MTIMRLSWSGQLKKARNRPFPREDRYRLSETSAQGTISLLNAFKFQTNAHGFRTHTYANPLPNPTRPSYSSFSLLVIHSIGI